MRRKRFICLLIAALLSTVSLVHPQPQTKIPKIGWLGGRSPGGPSSGGENMRLALRTRGYVEGKTVTIEYRYAEDKLDRLPALAEELVRLHVDLIIAPTTVEVRAAKARRRRSRSFSVTYLIRLTLAWLTAWPAWANITGSAQLPHC